jgi:phosphatidylglycerophosphatase A
MNQVIAEDVLPNRRWMMHTPWRLFAFGFGSGLSTIAPGTVGTLWAWAIGLLLKTFFVEFTYFDAFWLLIFGFFLGCWACGKTGEELGKPDHSGMVWDEIIAFWLVLLFVLPSSWKIQALAFLTFRYFDIAKPGPIQWIDEYFKHWDGTGYFGKWPTMFRGFGVMIDDLLATFFTLIVISIFYKLGVH